MIARRWIQGIVLVVLALCVPAAAAGGAQSSTINPASRNNPDFAWFSEARFGMFIHFSLASLFGKDLGYEAVEKVPYREYEANFARFNPSQFSAKQWVDVAEQAGCRYITLVAKHIEGFCLWDTKTTDFKITRTPLGRDIVKELADECHRRKMRLCLYINPDDWHSRFKPTLLGNWGDRLWDRDDAEPNMEKHIQYIEAQLTELLSHYGPIDGIWFDCTQAQENQIQGRRLYALIKRLQPQCIVNDRAKYGDFITPEWDIVEHLDDSRYLIEQCTSVAESGWGWRSDARYRSVPAVVDLLVRTAGSGSNLLLNVGPDSSGRIPESQVERMAGAGKWLARSGEAIYGTQGVRIAGLPPTMRATRRGNDLYLFLRTWPESERIRIPGILSEPTSARLLGGGPLRCGLEKGALTIDGLPAMPPDGAAQVVNVRFASAPRVVPPRDPVRTIVVAPVDPVATTTLLVKDARCEGLAVKGWRHRVRELAPGDAAYQQPSQEMPAGADQPDTDGPKLLRSAWAIIDWRHQEESTAWTVSVPRDMRVKVRVCLRCPKVVAGSEYELRAGGQTLKARVGGNGPLEKSVRMDWWRGYSYLPFVWEDAGMLDLREGRQELVMQPTAMRWGSNFADVMAVELQPMPQEEKPAKE